MSKDGDFDPKDGRSPQDNSENLLGASQDDPLADVFERGQVLDRSAAEEHLKERFESLLQSGEEPDVVFGPAEDLSKLTGVMQVPPGADVVATISTRGSTITIIENSPSLESDTEKAASDNADTTTDFAPLEPDPPYCLYCKASIKEAAAWTTIDVLPHSAPVSGDMQPIAFVFLWCTGCGKTLSISP